MSGYQTNLMTGIAQLLAAANVATWNTSGAYAANETGIFIKAVPQTPDAAISLTTYPVADNASLSDTVTGLQVRTRAAGQDPRAVDDLADAIFDQLHGLHDVTLASGLRVVQCLHQGGGSLGQDDLKRWGRSDNFYVTTWRPSLNRL
jgi:hypothetical protein